MQDPAQLLAEALKQLDYEVMKKKIYIDFIESTGRGKEFKEYCNKRFK